MRAERGIWKSRRSWEQPLEDLGGARREAMRVLEDEPRGPRRCSAAGRRLSVSTATIFSLRAERGSWKSRRSWEQPLEDLGGARREAMRVLEDEDEPRGPRRCSAAGRRLSVSTATMFSLRAERGSWKIGRAARSSRSRISAALAARRCAYSKTKTSREVPVDVARQAAA